MIEDLGSACGNVSGTLFIDHDQDCAQDANDPGVPFRVLNIEPGSELAITSTHGEYSRNLPLGSYTLAPSGSDLYPLCPSSSPVPFDLTTPIPLAALDMADSSLSSLDLETFISAGPARPGFVHQVQGQVRNTGGQLSSSVDATFTFDPSLSFIGAAPTPTSVVGNVVTWSGLPGLVGFDMLDFSVVLQVPPIPDCSEPPSRTFSKRRNRSQKPMQATTWQPERCDHGQLRPQRQVGSHEQRPKRFAVLHRSGRMDRLRSGSRIREQIRPSRL
ncbi:MAG: hypothetical protein IPG92_13935 [Flavobacteriales bacterium]|nr:hypothetical protein [Flavobacteriales bacterium]